MRGILVLAAAAALVGCGPPSAQDVATARAEAGTEFPGLATALDQWFAEHGEYPATLSDLGLATSAVTSSQGNDFTYVYEPATPSRSVSYEFGQRCKYRLVLSVSQGLDLGEGGPEPLTYDLVETDSCSPEMVADAEAEHDAHRAVVAAAIDDFGDDLALMAEAARVLLAETGTLPESLDDLDLPHAAATSTVSGFRYELSSNDFRDLEPPSCEILVGVYGPTPVGDRLVHAERAEVCRAG